MKETTLAALKAALQSDTPALLWGHPGVGKTAAIQALARGAGAHLETVLASAWDPGELLGYQMPVGDRLIFSPAPWVRRVREALQQGRPCWIFFDEISCAPPSVQAVLLRVVHERMAHEVSLVGSRIIGAANAEDTAAAEGWLSPASANRWMHLHYLPDPQVWVRGQMTGWGAGPSAASAFVSAWIRHSPTSLLSLPKQEDARGRGWPSPRSWSALASNLSALGGEPREALMGLPGQEVATGLVGPGAAGELTAWAASLDLPDPEDLLTGRAAVPSRGDQAHTALLAAVSAAAQDLPDRPQRIRTLWRILAGQRPDIAVTSAAALLDADPAGEIPEEAITLGTQIRGIQGKVRG